MTDNEIIANEILCIRRRANGRCNGGTDCNTCDLLMNETEIIKAYERAMKQNDLINRQKAEIERLREIANPKCQKCVSRTIECAKSEAIKELAHFVIDRSRNGVVYLSDIPDLVKEMTEVENGSN